MKNIFAAVVEGVVAKRMKSTQAKAEIDGRVEKLRERMREADRSVDSHLARGNTAVTRSRFVNQSDLERMRADFALD